MSLLPSAFITPTQPAYIPYYSTITGGGSNLPANGAFSTLTVSSILTVGSGQQGSFVKANSFFTSTFALLPAAANSSTLLLTTTNSGVYTWTGVGDRGTVNPFNNASIDSVAHITLGGSNYTTSLNLATTNSSPVVTGITTSQPGPGTPGPVEFYYVNNSAETPAVGLAFTQLG